MKLLQFSDRQGQTHVGLVDGDQVLDLSGAPESPSTIYEIYYDHGGNEAGLEEAVSRLAVRAVASLALDKLLGSFPADDFHLTKPVSGPAGDPHALRVWLAGVTHEDSVKLREIEAAQATGEQVNVYDQKYRECAAGGRPELFSKGDPAAVVGHNQSLSRPHDTVRLVPETELVSVYGLRTNGQVERLGYSGGNDTTDNGIEAANPLNLPQAKNWSGGCASIGPVLVTDGAYVDASVEVSCEILRQGERVAFKQGDTGQKHLNMPDGLFHMERSLFSRIPLEPRQLQVLYWGTPIVFSEADLADGLQVGDRVRMKFSGGIGTLENSIVAQAESTQLQALSAQHI